MSIYFIREGGLIKIGYSNDVRQRVQSIINSLRGKGEFLGCMPGDRELEKHFHRKFSADHEYGEWFRPSDALTALISSATSTVYPDNEKLSARDRLQQQEERYADEAAYYIRHFFTETAGPTRDTWDKLSEVTSIPAVRLHAIYDGQVCPVTAGEYIILRMMADVAEIELRGGLDAALASLEPAAERYRK